MSPQPVYSPPADVVEWLLEGDPAIRWQVLADLLDAPRAVVAAERALVATNGWGSELLALQDPDGGWAQALYSPKFTSTTYTLLLLQRLGLPAGNPQALAGVRKLWDGGEYHDGGLTLAKTLDKPEACITSMLVLLASHFGHSDPRLPAAVDWLLCQQLPDGGWNCRTVRDGSQHGSFNTTILSLEALLAYQNAGGTREVGTAMVAGRRFLLEHRLCRSHRTGELVDTRYLHFPFPPQWHYDVVRGLEHFRDVGAPHDLRMVDGLDVIDRYRLPGNRWRGQPTYAGKSWFKLEPAGPSRWATLRALRLLRWWQFG